MQAFGTTGGKLVAILPAQEEARRLRPDVEVTDTLVYTTLGRAFAFVGGALVPASVEDRAHMAQFLKRTTELVRRGQIKSNPMKRFDGGFEGLNAGLQYMKDGRLSGEKIVYRLSN